MGVLTNEQLHRIVGNIEGQLQTFANNHGISSIVLAQRVAELLYPEGQRHEDSVSSLPQNPTVRNKIVGRKVEVGKLPSNSSSRATGKVSGIKTYWDRMTPAQRKAEIARRMEKGLGLKTGKKRGPYKKASKTPKAPKASKKPYVVTPEIREKMRAARLAVVERKRKEKHATVETKPDFANDVMPETNLSTIA